MSSLPCCVCGRPGNSKCRCVHPAPIFCSDCFDAHVARGHERPGSTPSAAPSFVAADSDDSNLNYARMILVASLEEAQEARAEAAKTFNGLIQSVYQMKVRVDAQLAGAIERLASYVEYYLGNSFEGLVIDRLRTTVKQGELAARLNLLTWSRATDEFETCLEYAFVFSANTFLFDQDSQEVEVVQRTVPMFQNIWEMFYVEDGSKVNIVCPAAAVLKGCTVWIYIGENEVLMCGEQNARNAYVFSLESEQVQQLNPQIFIQQRPGVGRKSGFVYCFGGNWRDIQQRYCERFDEKTGQWTAIPTMQFPRCNFTPALEGSIFYLIGGWNCSTCEAFDTFTQGFKTLNFEMGYSGACLSLVYDGDVIILMNGFLSEWEKKTGSECPKSYGKWGDFTPLITVPACRRREKVYMIGFTKDAIGLYELDLSTKQISEKTSASGPVIRYI